MNNNPPVIPRKPTYWTPSRIALAVAFSAAFVAVGGMALAPMVQGQLGSTECVEAAEWHRQMGLKYSERQDQEYHYLAAELADDLAAKNGSCAGWDLDARGSYMDGQGQFNSGSVA